MQKKWFFTSESVTEGHPDKVCDRISDSILDAIIKDDPDCRVACETFVTTGQVNIIGEITTSSKVDMEKVARQAILDIGYDKSELGFDGETCDVKIFIDKQSPDIALGVDNSFEVKNGETASDLKIGAGDQGMMFGYASNETKELMPLAISLAHKLAKRLAKVRKDNILDYLRPDGKTQVTVEYKGDTPKRIDTIVISTQHSDDVSLEEIRKDIKKYVIDEIIDEKLMDENTKIFVNPTGRFVVGGPMGDSGLTGRKIIVDTYGGYGRHGGGAFSGKDPTKVDRSAAYAARYVAKNIVAAGLASKCEVQIAYAIGVASPVSIFIETFGTNKIDVSLIEKAVKEKFDLRPMAIIKKFDLKKPIYSALSSYGHMGREDLNVPWEKTDMVDELKKLI